MLGRLRGHSVGDDSLGVVPEEDLARYRAEDPVPAYAERLAVEGVLTDEARAAIEARAAELVEEALSVALEDAAPDPKIAHRSVFAAVGTPAAYSLGPFGAEAAAGGQPDAPEETAGAPAAPVETSYVDAVNRALREEMARDGSVIVMGQDVGVFEGAFRTTRGLHARWPERVLDTPIAESGTLGIAIGAALMGYRPVVEMQFADFVTCGFNQLVNVAAKLFYRWQVPCPIVVRLPSGGGVGAGPYHSQNPEGWFAHIAGLKVVCPATAADAHALLVAAIRDPNPVIFCEHKFLYRRIKETLAPDAGPQPLGEARVRRAGDRLSLIGYGAATWTCLEAAEELAARGHRSRGRRPAHPGAARRRDRRRLGAQDRPRPDRPRGADDRRLWRRGGGALGRRRLPLARRADPPRRPRRPAVALRQGARGGAAAVARQGAGRGARGARLLARGRPATCNIPPAVR